jgi:diguanylate cyclase (GGDEF)-like protein
VEQRRSNHLVGDDRGVLCGLAPFGPSRRDALVGLRLEANLIAIAVALVESFRPQDAVVRYAGDEFVIVASGLTDESVQQRVETLRTRLESTARDAIAIAFSYGVAELPPGGHPETALRAADEAMYRVKGLAAVDS